MNKNGNSTTTASILTALRRVMRAVDLHSRRLVQSHGLTGPQAVVIGAVAASQGLTSGALARRVNLSQATVTDIVKRLEARGLLCRSRDQSDRRRVLITTTAAGKQVHDNAPPLLQESFVTRFEALPEWEQNQLLSAVQRLGVLMDAGTLDAGMLQRGSDFDPPVEAQPGVRQP